MVLLAPSSGPTLQRCLSVRAEQWSSSPPVTTGVRPRRALRHDVTVTVTDADVRITVETADGDTPVDVSLDELF